MNSYLLTCFRFRPSGRYKDREAAPSLTHHTISPNTVTVPKKLSRNKVVTFFVRKITPLYSKNNVKVTPVTLTDCVIEKPQDKYSTYNSWMNASGISESEKEIRKSIIDQATFIDGKLVIQETLALSGCSSLTSLPDNLTVIRFAPKQRPKAALSSPISRVLEDVSLTNEILVMLPKRDRDTAFKVSHHFRSSILETEKKAYSDSRILAELNDCKEEVNSVVSKKIQSGDLSEIQDLEYKTEHCANLLRLLKKRFPQYNFQPKIFPVGERLRYKLLKELYISVRVLPDDPFFHPEDRNASDLLFKNAIELRKNLNSDENILWSRLYNELQFLPSESLIDILQK